MTTKTNNEWKIEFEKLKNRARSARDSGFCGGCEEYKKGVDMLLSDFCSLLSSERQRLQKMIMGKIIQDNQIIAETEEHKFGRGMLNFVLSDILKLIEE